MTVPFPKNMINKLILFLMIVLICMAPRFAFAESCGVKGYDGSSVVEFSCVDAADSPLKIQTPSGVKGIQLTDAGNTPFYVTLGDGTMKSLASGITISNCEDLQNIQVKSNQIYTLTNDIDCSATNRDKNNDGFYDQDYLDSIWHNNPDHEGFRPILWDQVTNVTLDGGGFSIINLNIKPKSDMNYIGLFSKASNGTVKNLSFVDATVSGYQYVGVLTGWGDNLILENIGFSGNVYGFSMVGGLVGYAGQYEGLTVRNIHFNSGTVSADQSVGGVFGYIRNSTVIDNVTFEGSVFGRSNVGGVAAGITNSTASNITATASSRVIGQSANDTRNCYTVGGITGSLSSSTLEDSYAYGDIEVAAECRNIGGAVGSASSATITNVVGGATVKGWIYTGGLVGYSSSSIISDVHVISGSVFGMEGHLTFSQKGGIGGIVGYLHSSEIKDSKSTVDVLGQKHVGGIAGYALRSETKIYRVFSSGNIESREYYAGGIVGYLTISANIEDALSSANVKTKRVSVGGIAGRLYSSSSVTNSLAIGSVTWGAASGSSCRGGVAGGVYSSSIKSSFADKTVNTSLFTCSSAAMVDSISKIKNTSELKLQSTFSAWDFTDTWKLLPGHYPCLQWQDDSTCPAP